MLKVNVAILLVLALFAFAVSTPVVLSLSSPELYNVSNSFIADDDPPLQPQGDPVEGGGLPH